MKANAVAMIGADGAARECPTGEQSARHGRIAAWLTRQEAGRSTTGLEPGRSLSSEQHLANQARSPESVVFMGDSIMPVPWRIIRAGRM